MELRREREEMAGAGEESKPWKAKGILPLLRQAQWRRGEDQCESYYETGQSTGELSL